MDELEIPFLIFSLGKYHTLWPLCLSFFLFLFTNFRAWTIPTPPTYAYWIQKPHFDSIRYNTWKKCWKLGCLQFTTFFPFSINYPQLIFPLLLGYMLGIFRDGCSICRRNGDDSSWTRCRLYCSTKKHQYWCLFSNIETSRRQQQRASYRPSLRTL